MKRYSVIIPSYNAAGTIQEVISKIKNLDNPPEEILVVNDGSTDQTSQKARNEKISLIDSPGIIPFNERNEVLLALIGAKNAEQISEIETVAEKILEKFLEFNPKVLEKEFGIKIGKKDAEELIKEIALKKKKLLKKGLPDLIEAAKIIVRKWQNGKLKLN